MSVFPSPSGVALGLAVLGLLAGSGCSAPEVEHPEWEGLELAEVQEAFLHPTGAADLQPSDATIARLEAVAPRLADLAVYFSQVGVSAETVAAADVSDSSLPDDAAPADGDDAGQDKTRAASVFVRLACPGTNLLPPFSFDDGYLQLESPRLSKKDLGGLVSEGEMLFDFQQCKIGDQPGLTAKIPGIYLTNPEPILGEPVVAGVEGARFAIAVSIADGVPDSPVGMFAFVCGEGGVTCVEDARVAVELRGDTGSYVVEFHLSKSWYTGGIDELSLTLRSSRVAATCTYSRSSRSTSCQLM